MKHADVAQPTRPDHVWAAVKWMAVGLFAFSLIAITGRAASRGLATIDIMFYRSWLGIFILAIVRYGSGQRVLDLRTPQPGLITLRSVIHFGAQYSWLSALTLIPLTQLFAIEFTAPLWTALLAPLFLKERLTGTRLLAAILGFVGVLVVVQPGKLAIEAGSLLALAAAVGFAFYFLATKQLTRRNEAFVLLFYMHVVQAVIATVLAAPNLKVPDAATALWVVALTVLGLAAHFSLAKAFSYADAIIVAPMDFLRLPLIAVVGMMVYGEPLEQLLVIGASIIVAANFINLMGERPRRGA